MALGTLILNAFSVRTAPRPLIRCRCSAIQSNVQTNTYDPRRPEATLSLLSSRPLSFHHHRRNPTLRMIRNDNLHPSKPYDVKGTQFLLRFVHIGHAIARAMAIHRLYGELAASLVRATTDRCEPGEPRTRAGAKLDGSGGLSAYEGALLILLQLGLATPEDKLAIDGDRVAHFVTERSRDGQVKLPPIDDVLEAWLSCAGQEGHPSLKRLPFVPHDDIRPVMNALVALDYARPAGNAFIWTDKIGRAMQMTGYWDENNLSRQELEEREVDIDMRKALACIPADVRHAALRGNRIDVVKALAARWIDGAWLPDTADEAPWWRLAAVGAEATRLVELVQGADDPLTRVVN
jgi:hypothetical protein